MSRTAFTLRFKETVGMSPIEYLRRWRMMVAGEAPFCTALKKLVGCSPRRDARGRIASLAAKKMTTIAVADGSTANIPGGDFMKAVWSIWLGKSDQPSVGDDLVGKL